MHINREDEKQCRKGSTKLFLEKLFKIGLRDCLLSSLIQFSLSLSLDDIQSPKIKLLFTGEGEKDGQSSCLSSEHEAGELGRDGILIICCGYEMARKPMV
jgi:hypothetical protein